MTIEIFIRETSHCTLPKDVLNRSGMPTFFRLLIQCPSGLDTTTDIDYESNFKPSTGIPSTSVQRKRTFKSCWNSPMSDESTGMFIKLTIPIELSGRTKEDIQMSSKIRSMKASVCNVRECFQVLIDIHTQGYASQRRNQNFLNRTFPVSHQC